MTPCFYFSFIKNGTKSLTYLKIRKLQELILRYAAFTLMFGASLIGLCGKISTFFGKNIVFVSYVAQKRIRQPIFFILEMVSAPMKSTLIYQILNEIVGRIKSSLKPLKQTSPTPSGNCPRTQIFATTGLNHRLFPKESMLKLKILQFPGLTVTSLALFPLDHTKFLQIQQLIKLCQCHNCKN